mgnify:CR=1 FL=1
MYEIEAKDILNKLSNSYNIFIYDGSYIYATWYFSSIYTIYF